MLRNLYAVQSVHVGRYDPDPSTSVIQEDLECVSTYVELEDESALLNLSPWLLRLELHTNVMVDKQLQNTDVAFRIAEEYGDALNCMFSDDNADKRIIRVSARAVACLAAVLDDRQAAVQESPGSLLERLLPCVTASWKAAACQCASLRHCTSLRVKESRRWS